MRRRRFGFLGGKYWVQIFLFGYGVYIKQYTRESFGLLFSQRTGHRGTILGSFYIEFFKPLT